MEGVCRQCGRSLTATYDPTSLMSALKDGSIKDRPHSMWRYHEALPTPSGPPVSLGEGFTPLLPAPVATKRYGVREILIKDESRNPTGSFKDRGLSAAITAAVDRGAKCVVAPSAGNAAGAMSAYAARAGIEARVFLPEDCPLPNRMETRLFGARTEVVKGNIANAAARLRETRAATEGGDSWCDLSTLKEPFRLDGKKTLGYELFESLTDLPDVILYPTGGGTGLLGMMKAFDELEQAGLIGSRRPRMIAVQSTGCAPLVKAFDDGAEESEAPDNPNTLASGLLVPKAFADWWVLKEIRRSEGLAVAVDDEDALNGIRELAAADGILLCPEGGALLAALRRLRDDGQISADDRVVVFNTASAYKYPEALKSALDS